MAVQIKQEQLVTAGVLGAAVVGAILLRKQATTAPAFGFITGPSPEVQREFIGKSVELAQIAAEENVALARIAAQERLGVTREITLRTIADSFTGLQRFKVQTAADIESRRVAIEETRGAFDIFQDIFDQLKEWIKF